MTDAPAPKRTSRRWLLLGAITLVAAALRFPGVDFGLPLQMRPDEEFLRDGVSSMARSGELNPHFFAYGSLCMYALLGAERVAWTVDRARGTETGKLDFAEFAAKPDLTTPVQRRLSALLGTLTVVLVWFLARRLVPHLPLAPPLASAALAVSFLHVRDSHFGTCDALVGFFTALAVLLAVRALTLRRIGACALAGLGIGLAAATRYVPGAILIPLVVATGFSRGVAGDGWRGRGAWRALACILGAAAGFFAAMPAALFDTRAVIHGVTAQTSSNGFGQGAFVDTAAALCVRGFPLALGVVGALIALPAFAAAIVRSTPERRMVAWSLVALLVVLLPLTLIFMRYLVPIAPLVCVLNAVFVARLLAPLPGRARMIVTGIAVVALCGEELTKSVLMTRLLAKETTCEQAHRYLRDDAPRLPIACLTQSKFDRAILGDLPVPDPLELFDAPACLMLVQRSTHPSIGHQPDALETLLRRGATVEVLRSFAAEDPTAASPPGYEAGDSFFFPLTHVEAALRGGPDIEILRVTRQVNGVDSRSRAPKPDIATTVANGLTTLHFAAGGPPPESGWILRWRETQDGPAYPWGQILRLDPDPPMFVVPPVMRKGHYFLQVRGIYARDISPWSDAAECDLR